MKLTKTWHKIVAVALAVVLLLSVIPIAQLVIAASTKTVYFQNNWLWTNVKIHYWGASFGSTFPGDAMEKVDTYGGYDIYSAEIPADTTGILFYGTKDDGSGNDQSPNIEGENIKTDGCYYMNWDNGNQVLFNANYTPPTEETDPPETTAPPATEPDTEEWIVFLKTNSSWDASSAVSIAHYWATGASGTTVTMQETGEDNLYYVTIPADCKNILFARANPSNGEWWNQTANLTVPNNYAMYTITSTNMGSLTGNWSTYTGTFTPPTPLEPFYVNTDIVDYLNDNRVTNSQVQGYYTDNQGKSGSENAAVFTYLNYVISSQNSEETKYTYPLYFGNLLYIDPRYGLKYNDSTKQDLDNWVTGANVGLSGNSSAVVQGLVGDTLNENGNLTDPETGEQLFYFDKTSADTWKASGGDKYVMKYYSNLQFPFSTTYDPATRVTTYSYDSATDDAVFIDFDSYKDTNDTNKMYTSSNAAKDYKGNDGFLPLNKPGDSGETTNFGFGVKFTIDFTVSKDGTIVAADDSETPVEFNFTGDDDVWVFIDDQLVLDMGGAHTMAEGSINFQTLSSTVKYAAQVEKNYKSPSYYYSTYGHQYNQEQRESWTVETKSTAFPETLAAGFRNEYTTGITQVHTLTMFYMERGMYESNMSIEFSMTPVPSGLTVSKDIAGVNPGLNNAIQRADEFSFEIEATYDGSDVNFDGYTLTDHNGVSEDQTATGNTITGVRGDRYARAFTTNGANAFLAGTTYTVKELSTSTVFSYTGTSWVLYDADNSYAKLNSGSGKTTSSLTMEEDKAGNYALNFVNTLNSGSITLKKVYNDSEFADQEFTFSVLIDLDGDGSNFSTVAYPGLTYKVGSTEYTSADGTVTLKPGQSAVISGVPVGATYLITEETTSSDAWTPSGSAKGTVTSSGTTATITNTTKSTTVNKVIYVEEGKATNYTLDETDTITGVTPSTNVSATYTGNVFTVTGTKAGTVENISYSSKKDNGERVGGTITVYTYKATDKVYVFDFGLSSEISKETTNGYGLFQGGTFAIAEDNATSTLTIGSSSGNQTTITPSGSTITESSVPTVTFKPVAFMTQVETYNYTVRIVKTGASFNANDPETGVEIKGTITVLPANTVYYEDNFNTSGSSSEDKIIFSNGINVPGVVNRFQSNDQDANYGFDNAYNSDLNNSHGNATMMSHGSTAFFSFRGTGFDLISRTNSNTAGFAVYVVAGVTGWNAETLESEVEKLEAGNTNRIVKSYFVDNYYANGDLYQIPVITADDLGGYDYYTVYIKALQTVPGITQVPIDAIRIYNPLGVNGSAYYLDAEESANVLELRDMYFDGKLDLAVNSSGATVTGDAQTVVENYEDTTYTYADETDVETVLTSGPNNELYLPKTQGVHFSYEVTDADWTLQLGMKAVGTAKKVGIYVNGTKVDSIDLATATDMYYDLTDYLENYCSVGTTYDIVILNESTSTSPYEFVSLTTVKYSDTVTLNP